MAFKDLATQKHDNLTPEQEVAKAIHIFVDTDFKISNNHAPIHVLAMTENWRYIRGLEYLIDKTFEEQTDEISQIVRAHFTKNDGINGPWGKIKRYHFRYKEEFPAIVFDPNGNIVGESNVLEGHAILLI